MPYVYIFSEKTRNEEQQKREFTDRNYFIDNFVPTEQTLVQATQQNVEQLEFLMDKLKDDIEEMTKNMLVGGKQKEVEIKKNAKKDEENFQVKLKEEEGKYSQEIGQLKLKIQLFEKQVEMEKTK